MRNNMKSIEYGNLLINFTSTFSSKWNYWGSGSVHKICFWRPLPDTPNTLGYFPLGDLASSDNLDTNKRTIVAIVQEADPESEETRLKGKALCPPTDFERIWTDSGSDSLRNCTLWRPMPPAGYVALGLVCETGFDKPSIDCMRCVREDLVMAAAVGDWLWNDKGSGMKTDFSAWSIQPQAATQGEVCFCAGTFVGTDSYTKPTRHPCAYGLKVHIPLKLGAPPPAPLLQGYAQPSVYETDTVRYTSQMAWFTVKDPDLSPIQQLQNSPTYTLQRTDRYVLVGFGHNQTSVEQSFKWATVHGAHGNQSRTFTHTTAIDIGTEWQVGSPASSIKVSAKLSNTLSHTQTSTSGWTTSKGFEIVAKVPSRKAIATYLIQSNYRLLRQDGTQVADTVSYTDINSVYWSEYPPTKECEVSCLSVLDE